MSGMAHPRDALQAAMVALRPLPRGERLARVSLWTMYYFSALIIPAVAHAGRTGRVPASAIDELLCECDSEGHVVGFTPRDGVSERTGFDALVDNHLAVAVAACGELAGFPARVGWSNAAVVIDHAIEEARAEAGATSALREAEALIAASGHPQLARPYKAGPAPRERRVCCLRYLLPDGALCPGICPKAPRNSRGALSSAESGLPPGKENPGEMSMPFRQKNARVVLMGAGLIGVALAAAPAGAATKPKLAVFDFQLANLAQLPPTKADNDRLPRISDLLRQQLADSGKFEIVPLTEKVKEQVAKAAPLRDCGGCAVDFAKELGADVAVTGQVQKVSDLILNINVYMKKVSGKDPETATSVDIRGDNDDSFNHGVKYLVKHNILKE